jgi:hypothetical protein
LRASSEKALASSADIWVVSVDPDMFPPDFVASSADE